MKLSLSESRDSGMENLSLNIVRKNTVSHPVQYDDKHKGPISVGVTREDWIAHMKTNVNNKTDDTTFPPKLHSPPPLNNNSLEENDKESENLKTEKERDGHLVTQEEDTDHISTTPHIVTSRLSQIRQVFLVHNLNLGVATGFPEK
ncbi:hypothetical protein LOTGIDRAFT_162866 [Lottia gigantea]|uniref:Uncharacterized protein n=1 Tax=Lottia gigantea TaxID=225164 RepID=V4AFQ0_LOTGI|nr:hypothetical protein LOTGIDRAFT_162866 [Lottia gigantea]ESO92211.1 hypothetical protein LOTGIDRAFT_162866 [Lottia gigantea]